MTNLAQKYRRTLQFFALLLSVGCSSGAALHGTNPFAAKRKFSCGDLKVSSNAVIINACEIHRGPGSETDLVVAMLRDGRARNGPAELVSISEADGSLRWRIRGTELEPGRGDGLGVTMTSIGDIDGDGVSDLAVGAPRRNESTGAVDIYSGARGNLIKSFTGPEKGASLGDCECVGINGASPARRLLLVPVTFPQVIRVYSMPSFEPLAEISGSMCAKLADVDLDGTDDFAACDVDFPRERGKFQVCVYSSRTLEKVREITIAGDVAKYAIQDKASLRIRSVPDLDHDGVPEIAIGSGSGAIGIYSVKSGALLHFVQLDLPADPSSHRKSTRLNVGAAWDFQADSNGSLAVAEADRLGIVHYFEFDLADFTPHLVRTLSTENWPRLSGLRIVGSHVAAFGFIAGEMQWMPIDSR